MYIAPFIGAQANGILHEFNLVLLNVLNIVRSVVYTIRE
jgi:hypothetical protein